MRAVFPRKPPRKMASLEEKRMELVKPAKPEPAF